MAPRLSGRGVVGGGFKANHRFVGSGVAEFFAGQTLEGLGVVAKSVNLRLELLGNSFLFLELGLQLQDVRAHPLILLNGLQITHPNQQQKSRDDENDDNFRQFAPNAEVDVHQTS